VIKISRDVLAFVELAIEALSLHSVKKLYPIHPVASVLRCHRTLVRLFLIAVIRTA
jgi:hypothetical protein